ncbi:MAG TPA: hypothetical protein DCF49_08320 [Lachnospiraceae bacterium]|nr:hypothetical protein [Lachnospiraceae bacterium]
MKTAPMSEKPEEESEDGEEGIGEFDPSESGMDVEPIEEGMEPETEEPYTEEEFTEEDFAEEDLTEETGGVEAITDEEIPEGQ